MTDTDNDFSEDEGYDVFDDSEGNTEAVEETEETETSTEGEAGAETEETGEDDDGTPPEEEKETEQSDKMIPEHRFKAALKDVNDKLEAANAKLAQMESRPVPDREADPDGYDLHMRMETSKAIMAETHTDYNDVIRHYQEMEKANPFIAQAVAAHPIPAKHAYDIAKKDMEIRELSTLKQSDDWTQFQEFKKQKEKEAKEAAKAASAAAKGAEQQEQQSGVKAVSKVPNLNRATDVSAKKPAKVDEDDELFAGAL